jgi:hypothetical protein
VNLWPTQVDNPGRWDEFTYQIQSFSTRRYVKHVPTGTSPVTEDGEADSGSMGILLWQMEETR